MWIIASNNLCTYLCKYRGDGKLSSTTDPNKAFKFESQVDAENYIRNHLPKSVRSRYVVIEEKKLHKNEEETKEVKWLGLRSSEVTSLFQQLAEILTEAPAYKKFLEDKLRQVEDSLVDIYHHIEFNDLGTVDGYKIYKKEQEFLRIRRQLKEELYCAEQLLKHIHIEGSDVNNYLRSVEKTKNREYIPKVLTELFE